MLRIGLEAATWASTSNIMGERREDRTSRMEFLKVWGPLLVLVGIGFAVTISRLEPPPPQQFKIAAGIPGGAYLAFAERYQEILEREGYDLEVVQTTGSLDNLERLRRGEVDLALVQGGTIAISFEEDRGDLVLHSLGSLFLEPVWVFHRSDLPVAQLRDLRGCRIAIGQAKSGTNALSRDLLLSNGIDSANSELLLIGGADAAQALLSGQLDAAFFVTSVEASYVRQLLSVEGVEVFSILRHRAYRSIFRYLSSVVLGEGALDLGNNVPAREITLLATAASMVARDDLHKALIPLLLRATQKVHLQGGLFEEPGAFPSTDLTDLPMATEAAHYIESGPSFLVKILPFRYAQAIDRWKLLLLPFITLLIPVFKVAPPLYRWRIRRRIFRWYEDLKRVDEILRSDHPARAEVREYLAALRRLEKEVTEVQVPLSYMDEFYRLRIHIALILARLRGLEEEQPVRETRDHG